MRTNCLPVGDGFYKKHLKKKTNNNKVVLWHSSLRHGFLLPTEIIGDALNSEPCFSSQRVRLIPPAERSFLSTARSIRRPGLSQRHHAWCHGTAKQTAQIEIRSASSSYRSDGLRLDKSNLRFVFHPFLVRKTFLSHAVLPSFTPSA